MVVVAQINKNTFLAHYKSLAEIAAFIQSNCRTAGLDNSSGYHVETAVDEACSNIIEHAYGGEGKGNIEISCQSIPQGMRVVIMDQGIPFKPDHIPIPDLKASLEERANHGLGLFFIYKFMDKVTFSTGPDKTNILTMEKYRK